MLGKGLFCGSYLFSRNPPLLAGTCKVRPVCVGTDMTVKCTFVHTGSNEHMLFIKSNTVFLYFSLESTHSFTSGKKKHYRNNWWICRNISKSCPKKILDRNVSKPGQKQKKAYPEIKNKPKPKYN